MIKIALISDNHSYVGEDILEAVKGHDEIWHAGDIGTMESINEMRSMATFRGVYGNIDTGDVKESFGINEIFEVEGIKVLMTHIGGYPSRYKTRVRDLIIEHKPDLYICGHSHILKVMRDHEHNLLHFNPGAYGHHGFHKIRTMLSFEIEKGKIENLKVIEFGIRGHIK